MVDGENPKKAPGQDFETNFPPKKRRGRPKKAIDTGKTQFCPNSENPALIHGKSNSGTQNPEEDFCVPPEREPTQKNQSIKSQTNIPPALIKNIDQSGSETKNSPESGGFEGLGVGQHQISPEIADSALRTLVDAIPAALAALIAAASDPDPKCHHDRVMFFRMIGLYAPKTLAEQRKAMVVEHRISERLEQALLARERAAAGTLIEADSRPVEDGSGKAAGQGPGRFEDLDFD